MPRHAEQAAPGETASKPRRQIDAKTRRLGVEQTRGTGKDEERVYLVDETGAGKTVWIPKSELKNSADRADKDFDRTVAAVTAGRDVDAEAASKLFQENKEAILTLAGKEADIGRAVYRVMEDAVDALAEYDRLVDKAVEDSGYTGIVADGLRNSLAAERSRIFSDAFKKPASARTKRTLENAVRGKFLAESAKQVAALAETIGDPSESEEPGIDDISDIQADIALLRNVEASYKQNRGDATLQARVNALDRSVEQSAAHWAALYLTEHPRASVAEVMRLAEESGLDEFLTKKDVERLKKGDSVGELHAKLSPQDLDEIRAARTSVEYVGGYRVAKPDSMEIIDDDQEDEALEPARSIPFPKRNDGPFVDRIRPGALKEGPGAPLEQAIVDTGEHDPRLDEPKRRAAAKRREMNPTRMEDYDAPTYAGDTGSEEIPDVTDLLQDDEPTKKGFLQGLAKKGRNLMLGMALLFGIKAGAPDQRLPHQEDQGPQRENAAMMANMETMAAPTGDVVDDAGGMEVEQDESLLTETPKDAGDVEYKKGDPRNLKRALRILKDSGLKGRAELALERHQNLQGALEAIDESGLPGKAEFRKMKNRERREELESAMGRIEAMRLIGDMKSPVLDAVRRADLKKKLEQHQAFLDTMANLDEIK